MNTPFIICIGNFLCLIYIQADLLCYFLLNEKAEDKQTRNLVSFDPANSEMSKIYRGNFQFLCRLAQLFLHTSAVVLRKKSEIIGEKDLLS